MTQQNTLQGEAAQGLIVKALGGFYYVQTGQQLLECRARGLFRKEDISPMVGDQVMVEESQPGKGTVTAILPRKNSLIRPPVANLDRLAMVVSSTQPEPNVLVIDKLTAIAARRGIPVTLIFTKMDLADPEAVAEIYRCAGYETFLVDSLRGEGIDSVRQVLQQGLTAFCGNSGAGKSSLLNALFPHLELATGDISKKLGRGRHTTRHVELYATGCGGYIADTPGFSAVEFLQFERMLARELEDCFPEFRPFLGKCRYTGCSHTAERECAIRQAVEEGIISQSRYQSYCTIYQELRQIKEWQL